MESTGFGEILVEQIPECYIPQDGGVAIQGRCPASPTNIFRFQKEEGLGESEDSSPVKAKTQKRKRTKESTKFTINREDSAGDSDAAPKEKKKKDGERSRNWSLTFFPRTDRDEEILMEYLENKEESKIQKHLMDMISKIVCIRMQPEYTSDNKLHYQGYICYGSTKRVGAVFKDFNSLFPQIEIKKARDMTQLANYCSKAETADTDKYPIIEVGAYTTVNERISAGIIAKNKGVHISKILETGITKNDRCIKMKEYMQRGGINAQVVKLEKHFPSSAWDIISCKAQVERERQYVEILTQKQAAMKVKLLPWQQELYNELRTSANDRKIVVYVDKDGAKGKSLFTNFYTDRHPTEAFTYTNGKSDTIKYRLITQNIKPKVVIVDLSRTDENIKDDEDNTKIKDFINYSLFEEFKNGNIMSCKYQGGRIRMPSPHLVIFTNNHLNYKRCSSDRWDIREMTNMNELPTKYTVDKSFETHKWLGAVEEFKHADASVVDEDNDDAWGNDDIEEFINSKPMTSDMLAIE